MRKILRTFIIVISLAIFIIVSLGIYITYIERTLLIVKEENITVSETGTEELKVVQFTDTQLGEYYTLEQLKKVVKKINMLDADIVVFTGDLIDNAAEYEELFHVAQVLSGIESNYGNYAIYGNHDYGGGAEIYYEDIMEEAGFHVLKNESVTIKVKNRNITIFGGDEALIGNHNVEETMAGIKEENINLLLIHEPDLMDEYVSYPLDLILSGHSHGGQVYLPFYGPIKKNLLAEKYNKGFFTFDNVRNSKLYVSSGLGNTKVPFRFFNIPEIMLFNLKI